MWAIAPASQAGYAMCVASVPQFGHHDSFASGLRHVRRLTSVWFRRLLDGET